MNRKPLRTGFGVDNHGGIVRTGTVEDPEIVADELVEGGVTAEATPDLGRGHRMKVGSSRI
jgi:hypothetical protein